jgi:hypothetical protein
MQARAVGRQIERAGRARDECDRSEEDRPRPPEAETIEERVAKATGALIAGRTLGAVLGEAK